MPDDDNDDNTDDDEEPEGPMVTYRCHKCGEKITFTMMAGTPLEELPCKCGGALIADPNNREMTK